MMGNWALLQVLLLSGLLQLSIASGLNGGTYLALAGKDCVVVATDSRFSSLRHTGFLLQNSLRAMHRVGSATLLALFGLEADAHNLVQSIREQFVKDSLTDEHVYADNVASLVSHLLYKGEFTVVPIVCGFRRDGAPYICSMDGIGAQTVSNSFAAVGTSSNGLLAICEQLYQANLDSEEAVCLTERCLRLAFKRDVLSGGRKMKLAVLQKKPSIAFSVGGSEHPAGQENGRGDADKEPTTLTGDHIELFVKEVEMGDSE